VTATVFDPLDEEFLADPYGTYAYLRDHDPLHRTGLGLETVAVITRYDDIKHLMRDNEGLMQPVGAPGPRTYLGDGPALAIYRGLMVLNDPPIHGRLRKLAQHALTRNAVEQLRPRVEEVVDDALEAVAQRGSGELDGVSDLAVLVPFHVICGMLGIPVADREMLLSWTPDFFRVFLPAANDEAGIAACNAACQNYIGYLGEQIEYNRRHPSDTIFSALVQAEEDGDRLSNEELVSTVLALLTGGFDTTMGMLGAGLYLLAQQPDQLRRLREDPVGLASAATEEFLRWETPVQVTYRYFDHDLELAHGSIAEGEAVWLALASANRDERRFSDPNRIDIDRPDNKHIVFGGTRHFCIGNHLARVEGEVTFAKVAQRWDAIEVVGKPRRRPNFQFRSFESLPLRVREARV
jgi:cytochrome P450